MTAASSMALAVALGFLAASVFGPVELPEKRSAGGGGFHWLPRQRHGTHEVTTTIDALMENKR
jgi:hypothetical protein